MSLVHFKEKLQGEPYTCVLCPDAKFGQKAHLDNHMRQMHGGNIVKVALAEPDQSTPHYVVVTSSPTATTVYLSDSNQFKCGQCNESFTTSNNLRVHQVSVHETNPSPTVGHFMADQTLFQLT